MASLFGATALTTTEIAPGLLKEETRAAPAGAEVPQTGATVYVHYTGKLLDGTVFDSSVTRGRPFAFKVGIGSVIRGWDLGVLTMPVSSKCVLTCSYDNAYGEAGMPPTIPAKSTLVFEVECLSIGKPPAGQEEDGWCSVA